jgi:hypothetical protein
MTLQRTFWLGSLALILGTTPAFAQHNRFAHPGFARPAIRHFPAAPHMQPAFHPAMNQSFHPVMNQGYNAGFNRGGYGTIQAPYVPYSAPVAPVSSYYGYSPLQFSSGLNNPYWGNSANPFATLASPLTFAPGLNNPYWRPSIQNAANQATAIYYQRLRLQNYYNSLYYNPLLYQNPYTNPYLYSGFGNGGYGAFGGGVTAPNRFLDVGPLGAAGVAAPADGMAAIGAGFPAALGR